MNDNRPDRPRPRLVIVTHGLPEKPEPCFCGHDDTFVDAVTMPTGKIIGYQVTCPHCGAEGEAAASYDAAVSFWNNLTAAWEHH
jgi:hypothetical protein